MNKFMAKKQGLGLLRLTQKDKSEYRQQDKDKNPIDFANSLD